MKPHARIGTVHQNCIMLGQDGVLHKGIPLDRFGSGGGFWPKLTLRQGARFGLKSLEYYGRLESVYEQKRWCALNARLYREQGVPALAPTRPRSDYPVLLYIPSFVQLPFGAGYASPLELVEGPVVYHPSGRVRDGNFVLGEAWEDDKTALIALSPEMKVMVATRTYDGDKGYYVKVVTIVRSRQFLIMRYPRKDEMQWFTKTMKEIRAEEYTARKRSDGVYRSRMQG